MSKQLSTSGFQWMTDDELDDWKHLSCILEVDLDYPEQLHNLHNDYALAPECALKLEMSRNYFQIWPTKHITLCIKNLKLCKSLDLKITQILRGINVEESAWLVKYINLNTKVRIEAKQSGSNFEVDFFSN